MRPRATYANVTATLALVVALGGGAYAATALPKNSVGAAQLKKDAVTSVAVKDRSLLARDFKAGQLPAGPQGPAGAAGTAGDVVTHQAGTQQLLDLVPLLTHDFDQPGAFVLEGVVSAYTSAAGPVDLQCSVSSTSSSYETSAGLVTLGAAAGGTRQASVTVLATVATAVAGDEASLQCTVDGSGTVTLQSARWHVTRVASIADGG